MKLKISFKRLTAMLLALSIFPSISFAYYDDDHSVGNMDMTNWFEWELPDDAAAMGTPIDASRTFDKPAGKHGYLHSEGEKMFFEDGTEIRFWGTVVALGALWMTHEEAEILADRIARSGFNIVRLHHVDWNDHNNIFGAGFSTKSEIDPDRLDRLHYFVHCLKERGVYTNLDIAGMHASFPEDPGQNKYKMDPEAGGQHWFGGKYFDDEAMETLYQYARDLLNTPNPYTGYSLGTDPAVALIDIDNESGALRILQSDANVNRTIIQGKFNDYLRTKYGTDEALRQAWTQSGRRELAAGESLATGTVIFQNNCMDYFTYTNEYAPSDQELADIRDFLYKNQVAYYEKFSDVIRNECGYKGMLVGVSAAGGNHQMPLLQEISANMFDYQDIHLYKSHPFGSWRPGGGITGWTSTTIYGGGELYRWSPSMRTYNLPYIIAEWNVCAPGPYAAEGIVVQSVLARMQGWNPMQFDMYAGDSLRAKDDVQITSSFDTFYSADQTTAQVPAALIFHRGEDDVKQLEDEYYVTYDHEDVTSQELYAKYILGFESMFAYSRQGTALIGSPRCADYEPEVEVMERTIEKFKNNEDQNEDIAWNRHMGVFRVDTDYTNVATGYIGSKKIELDFSDIELENYSGTVCLNSVTDDTLENSNSILLTTVTRSRNKGTQFDDETGATFINVGTAPQLMEPVVCDITIKTTDDITVYVLNSSGQRTGQTLPVDKTEKGYSHFKADGNLYKTCYYEITK